LIALVLAVALSASVAPAARAGDDGVTAFRDKLYDVAFVSPREAWVVGYPGLVLHTTDAGATWERVKVPAAEALFAVDFPDPAHGWIVGRSGTILATENGGKTWELQQNDSTEHLFAVDFIDARRGWAAGNFGTILRTEDGGKTWQSQVLEPMTSAGIYSIFFQDANRGWLVGEYPIWEAQLEEDVEASSISNMFRTDDGGTTWHKVSTKVSYTLYDIAFTDEDTGWAVGSRGILIATTDGGLSWEKILTDTESHLLNIAQAKDRLWIAGADGTLLVVEGGTPRLVPLRIYTWFSAVSFGDPAHGLLVGGRGTVLRTDDGGKTWK